MAETVAVRERPMPFTDPNVRLVQSGAKWQTRRGLKVQAPPGATSAGVFFAPGKEFDGEWNWLDGDPRDVDSWSWVGTPFRCPYGKPGDRLWVRETWGYRGKMWGSDRPDEEVLFIRYRADDPQPERARPILCARHEHDAHLPKQRARVDGESYDSYDAYLTRYWQKWRPPMFMPRWACRLLLEVTHVGVERLQDISEADVIAEGCPKDILYGTGWYRDVWNGIHGAGAWDENPWVWVVQFKKIEAAS